MKRLIISTFLVGLIFSYIAAGPVEQRGTDAIGGGLLFAAIAWGVARYARWKGSPNPLGWAAAVSLTIMIVAAVGVAGDAGAFPS